jgi:hypothetical protein
MLRTSTIWLFLLFISSAFIAQAQDQGKSIPEHLQAFRQISQRVKIDTGTVPTQWKVIRPLAVCSCAVQTQVITLNRSGTIWTFKGAPVASCSGQILTTPGQFTDSCGVRNLTYFWEVESGNDRAMITGSNTGDTVNVLITREGPFTLSLVNTLTCTDGNTCSAEAYYTGIVEECDGCTCDISVSIQRSTGTDSLRAYFGRVEGTCTGKFRRSSFNYYENCDSCGPMKNITYQWSIVSGTDVAQIVGPSNQQFVQVKIIKGGPYSLQLVGNGYCQDDETHCSKADVIKDSLPCPGCKCEISEVTIVPRAKSGNVYSYNSQVKSSCKGSYAVGPGECITCSEPISKTYKWSITSGSDIATIIGADNGPSVNVQVRNAGRFTLKLLVTVKCPGGGDDCTEGDVYEEIIPCTGCECDVTAEINKNVQVVNDSTLNFLGRVNGNCTGRYQNGADCVDCKTTEIRYKWSITVGNAIAHIKGPDNGPMVKVIVTGCGTIVVKLLGTTVCSDGSECRAADILELPVGPGCECDANVSINEASKRGNIWTYTSQFNATCGGEFNPPTCEKCKVLMQKYKWKIAAGPNVAEIVGPDNGPSVTVKILKPGDFTITMVGTTVCSDKKECSDFDFRLETVPKAGFCSDSTRMDIGPPMSGGLMRRFTGSKQVKLNELIPLGAEGRDYDLLNFFCIPSLLCDKTRSQRDVALNGRVRFEWTVLSGGGGFVKSSSGPVGQTDSGDLVLFRPPTLAPPVSDQNPTVATVIIRLLVIDDNPTGAIDPVVERQIIVTLTRHQNPANKLTVDVSSPVYVLPMPPSLGQVNGGCQASSPWWKSLNDLATPVIFLPEGVQNKTIRTGEWVILRASDDRDPDKLFINCTSWECPGTLFSQEFEDNVRWVWDIAAPPGLGTLVQANGGRFVAYRAPDNLPANRNRMQVRISAKAFNGDSNRMIYDVTSHYGNILLTIVR